MNKLRCSKNMCNAPYNLEISSYTKSCLSLSIYTDRTRYQIFFLAHIWTLNEGRLREGEGSDAECGKTINKGRGVLCIQGDHSSSCTLFVSTVSDKQNYVSNQFVQIFEPVRPNFEKQTSRTSNATCMLLL